MSQGDLTRAAQCVEQASTLFANRAAGYRPHVNVLSAGDGAPCLSAGGDPNIRSGDSCRWPADGEVRAIDVDRRRCSIEGRSRLRQNTWRADPT
ncbi:MULTISPECIES: hypothetical protein [Burkholderia]|uniref:hypothetical protein n=1 Tax=Burkholderia TaxID=32008 RepID=UPI001269C16E|nr:MULTISPECIES: hypothetical protein [Burkholderia]